MRYYEWQEAKGLSPDCIATALILQFQICLMDQVVDKSFTVCVNPRRASSMASLIVLWLAWLQNEQFRMGASYFHATSTLLTPGWCHVTNLFPFCNHVPINKTWASQTSPNRRGPQYFGISHDQPSIKLLAPIPNAELDLCHECKSKIRWLVLLNRKNGQSNLHVPPINEYCLSP